MIAAGAGATIHRSDEPRLFSEMGDTAIQPCKLLMPQSRSFCYALPIAVSFLPADCSWSLQKTQPHCRVAGLGRHSMDRLMRILCWIIGHRRSRSRAFFDPGVCRWRSFCRRCRTPMLREPEGRWHPADDAGAV